MIRLPIDIKSLYFNIKNDNLKGHTPTVATPIKKKENEYKLEDIFLLNNKEIDISSKTELLSILIKHSKTDVIIKKFYNFKKLTVNGKLINSEFSFGCYIKEEIDNTKIQFGRLKLHYPSKLIYEDDDLKINNREIYKAISSILNDYAFIIKAFEYNPETDTLNFDALIVGENNIPYSKVFINEKGVGNKFNLIFNENADDYDREIISLRKKYGEQVNPYNYLDYFKKLKEIAYNKIKEFLNSDIILVSYEFPYSLFDFYYTKDGIRKYGILRVTTTKRKYFNLSFTQQLFMKKTNNDTYIFLISDILNSISLMIYKYDDLSELVMNINSIKYEEGL